MALSDKEEASKHANSNIAKKAHRQVNEVEFQMFALESLEKYILFLHVMLDFGLKKAASLARELALRERLF